MDSKERHGEPGALEPGLYLVATPIGNLEDITLRALRVLKSCSLVAAEDTRRIRKLLNHYDIKVKTISYREHNRARATPMLLSRIRGGSAVALVSDAGTPGISDPGAELVAACVEAGMTAFVVPGASAVVSALALSGLPADRFTFMGFPPARAHARRRLFEELRERPETLVMFESPHRLESTLGDLMVTLGDRNIVIARELTKIHEERMAGKLSELRKKLAKRERVLGEFTIVIEGAVTKLEKLVDDKELRERFLLLVAEGVKPNDALRLLSEKVGRSKRELYRILRIEKSIERNE